MRAFLSILLAAALPLAACTTQASNGLDAEIVTPVVELPAECAVFAGERILLAAEPGVARLGETVSLRAYVAEGPGSPKDVPLGCLAGWTVAPAGAATLSPDHSRLTIAREARSGELLTVEAQSPGGSAHLTTTLIGSGDLPFAGRWRQVEIDCPGGATPREPVRELEFGAQGRFSVTYLPFETYKDYWGEARFDAAQGRLTLTVDGGNRPPRDGLLEGRARLDAEGRLVLEDFHLGGQDPMIASRPCRYLFAR